MNQVEEKPYEEFMLYKNVSIQLLKLRQFGSENDFKIFILSVTSNFGHKTGSTRLFSFFTENEFR